MIGRPATNSSSKFEDDSSHDMPDTLQKFKWLILKWKIIRLTKTKRGRHANSRRRRRCYVNVVWNETYISRIMKRWGTKTNPYLKLTIFFPLLTYWSISMFAFPPIEIRRVLISHQINFLTYLHVRDFKESTIYTKGHQFFKPWIRAILLNTVVCKIV